MMQATAVRGLALAAALALASTTAWAQAGPKPGQQDYSGSSLYRTYCASCHGTEAKGDGPIAEHLRVRPSDLTQISKRHEGKFPTEEMQKIVDGRQPVRGHGGGDMPVWGDAFKNSIDRSDDAAVRAKVAALVDYLESIQKK
jgi:mono/diheme cytochrome c family protein